MQIFLRLFKFLARKNTMFFVLIVSFVLIFICGTLFSIFESIEYKNANEEPFTIDYLWNWEENDNDLIDGYWWSIVTMTTVGYGDKYPVSAVGRIVAVPLMIIGIGILGLLIGVIADSLLSLRSSFMKGLGSINFSDHIIICGFNQFKVENIIKEIRGGDSLADKPIVLVNNILEENIFMNENVHFIKGHPSDAEVLKRAGIEKCKKAIILAEGSDLKSDDTTILTVLQIESLNKNVFTCAELIDIGKADLLKKANCDEIVTANDFSVKLMVQSIEDPGLSIVLGDMLSNQYGASIESSKVDSRFIGKTYSDMFMNMYENKRVAIAIKHGEKHIVSPEKDLVIGENDTVYYIAKNH